MRLLFKNKYKIGSIRYRGFDYSLPGKYFITVKTKNRIHYFGEIIYGDMHLSELGEYLKNEWEKTPGIRQDMNIILDEFVIMPDHFHAIIEIGRNQYNCGHTMHCVSTTNDDYSNRFAPQSKNLASIVRGIKSSVTTYARKMKIDFEWQSRYYDHIIRTNIELIRIRKYIRENPKKF
jgi:REP element-mobilizing transposase RayT